MNVSKVKPTLKQEIGVVTRGQKRKLAQINTFQSRDNRDTGVCESCQAEVSSQHNQCSNSHLLCESCLKVAIRTSISTEQTSLTCPVRRCQAEITLDKSGSSFCVTLFRAHVQGIVSNTVKPVTRTKATPQPKEVVSCPFCKTTARLSDAAVVLKCSKTSCQQVVCRFCRVSLSTDRTQRMHVGCELLKFPGSSCWTDLSKLPVNWSKYEDSEYKKASGCIRVLVPLESEEGSSVVNFYRLSSSRVVKEVCRIQSPHLWQRYALKKKNMLTELAVEDLHERPLFHGTGQCNKPKILAEGFDCRKGRASGLCGQGTYFSPSARYSETFAHDRKLFIAYVLCGKSTSSQANREYPPCDKHGRTYDSIVDYHLNPNMYVIFCSSQCYPAYLVTVT